MSDTPSREMNLDEYIAVVGPRHAAAMELESLKNKLRQWELAFETTNPAQAKAERLAVLEKRVALQTEVILLKEELRKRYPYDD